MIITLKGITEASKHLGQLGFYYIRDNTSSGVTLTLSQTSVDKDSASGTTVTGTLTVADGYTLSSVAITMGGTDITSSCYTESTGAISITGITGNVVITAIATSNSTSGEDSGDSGDSSVAYTLQQGAWIADGTLYSATNRVCTTEKIKGKFTVTVNSGFAIRAVYEYDSTDGAGTMVSQTSETLTSFTSTNSDKYYGVTFTYASPNAANDIAPTENIIAEWKYV